MLVYQKSFHRHELAKLANSFWWFVYHLFLNVANILFLLIGWEYIIFQTLAKNKCLEIEVLQYFTILVLIWLLLWTLLRSKIWIIFGLPADVIKWNVQVSLEVIAAINKITLFHKKEIKKCTVFHFYHTSMELVSQMHPAIYLSWTFFTKNVDKYKALKSDSHHPKRLIFFA